MALIEVDGPRDGVACLTLRRPEKRNALSNALRDEMSDALDALAVDESVKVAIITGEGPVFSAGFDLSEIERIADPEFAREWDESSVRWHATVLGFPVATVAAVNGPALAGGFDLAVMCDLRVAVPEARFAHPEVAFSDVVYGPLHDLVGGAIARELIFTGRSIDAAEAQRLHLVSAVVARGDLLDEAHRWAAQIAVAPREVLVRTKAKAVRRARVIADGALDL